MPQRHTAFGVNAAGWARAPRLAAAAGHSPRGRSCGLGSPTGTPSWAFPPGCSGRRRGGRHFRQQTIRPTTAPLQKVRQVDENRSRFRHRRSTARARRRENKGRPRLWPPYESSANKQQLLSAWVRGGERTAVSACAKNICRPHLPLTVGGASGAESRSVSTSFKTES